MNEHIINFYDGIDTNELIEIQNTINNTENNDIITINFCNGGGSVFHGIGMSDLIQHTRETKNVKFTARIWGLCASAATLVALSCDKVLMSRHSAIMYHSAWNASGNVDDGIKNANNSQLSILKTRIDKLSSKDFEGEDHWISAQEAVDRGIADEIIGKDKDSDSSINNVLRIAAKLIFQGELKMESEDLKQELKEEVIEEQKELEADENSDAPKSLDDVLEVIVQRLEAIEHRLGVLEGEGKKQDDEMAECGDDNKENYSALYARLLKPSASIKKSAKVQKDSDLKAELDDFNKRINISDYLR